MALSSFCFQAPGLGGKCTRRHATTLTALIFALCESTRPGRQESDWIVLTASAHTAADPGTTGNPSRPNKPMMHVSGNCIVSVCISATTVATRNGTPEPERYTHPRTHIVPPRTQTHTRTRAERRRRSFFFLPGKKKNAARANPSFGWLVFFALGSGKNFMGIVSWCSARTMPSQRVLFPFSVMCGGAPCQKKLASASRRSLNRTKANPRLCLVM